MIKIRYLFKNITLLNVLLMAAMAFMTTYSILPLMHINLKNALPAQKKVLVDKEAAGTEHPVPSPSDYLIISEENLFHPERRIPPEKKDEPPPLPKPDIVLYGTLITDTISVAYLEDLKAPRTTPGRGNRQIALKKGDTLSGFILKEIDVDKIVMMRGEERMEVSVNDAQRPKTRTATVTAGKTSPGQASPIPQRQPGARQQKSSALEALSKRQAPTKNRTPMTPTDEKARQFFTK
jgi:hypothetical protein